MKKFAIEWYDSLSSTNTFLKERVELDKNILSGTVVVTREQTQGRGRRERSWLAKRDENLTFSLFFKPKEIKNIPSASMAAAISVAQVLTEYGIDADLKWPNDVLVVGKKICGILSEGVNGGIVIGIGLNVNMSSVEHIDQPATSMLIETKEKYDIKEILGKLLVHLKVWLTQWEKGGFPQIRKVWEANVSTLGKKVSVRDGDSRCYGTLFGFGENGELLLKDECGEICEIWAGDVLTRKSDSNA